jgi:hypothetical protein
VTVYPVDCCGHAVLDCAWLADQCKFMLSLCVTSLQVREVIVIEEAGFTKPVSDSLQVRECAEEGESSWKEPCSCHRAQRFLVRPVAEAQGKGG